MQLATLAIIASCLGVGFFLLVRSRPRWAMVLWTATLFFIPLWLGVNGPGMFINVLTAVTVLCVASGYGANLRWSFVDTVVLALLAVILLAQVVGGAAAGHVQQTLLTWFLPYVWGRLVLGRVSQNWIAACIAVAALVASSLAIIEFMTGQNLFLLVPGDAGVWGEQQIRGGQLRAEGAFGHSIALGGTLAMSAAFVLIVQWPTLVRGIVLAVVGVAVALTFSRLGIIGFALTVLLALLLLGRYLDTIFRIVIAGALVVGAGLALPVLLEVFGESGAEAEGSAGYRLYLVQLFDAMTVLGISPAREVLATGEDYWGGFRSIDSALILTGLRFGLICVVIVVVLLVALVVGAVRRPSPAGIALVAQIPAFATVALITQYAVFVWFAAGLAVASYTLESRSAAAGLEERHDAMQRVVEPT